MDESKISENQDISEEKQLQDQLERICLDYQLLVNKGQEMAPKGTNSRKTDPNTENNVDDDDLEGLSLFFLTLSLCLVERHCTPFYLLMNLCLFFLLF